MKALIKGQKTGNEALLVSNRLLQNELEQSTEDGSHTHGRDIGNVTRSSTLAGGARGLRSSARGGTRLTVLALRVGLLGRAGVRTTDNLVLVLLVETVTVEVTSALDVETTLDVLQLGHLNPSRNISNDY